MPARKASSGCSTASNASSKKDRSPRAPWTGWARHPTRPPRPTSKPTDRKSTRLNSSHGCISYAVFCLKKTTEFRGMKVPYVRVSGNHAQIAKWRMEQAAKRTKERRLYLMNEDVKRDASTLTTAGI